MKDKNLKKDFLDLFAEQLVKLHLTELGFNYIPGLRKIIEANNKKISDENLIVKSKEK